MKSRRRRENREREVIVWVWLKWQPATTSEAEIFERKKKRSTVKNIKGGRGRKRGRKQRAKLERTEVFEREKIRRKRQNRGD